MLDIRMPIGLMFLIIGALLAGYGLTQPAEAFKASLGHNLDLIWGAVMGLFGLGLLGLVWRERPSSGHTSDHRS